MQSVIDFPWTPAHITENALVKTGRSVLHTIVLNGLTVAGDITVYNGVDAGGTVIAILHLNTATSVSVQPITFTYDCLMLTGIYIAYGQGTVADLTVTFK